MDDSEITFDEIKESYDKETKIVLTNFNEKKVTCKTQNFYIYILYIIIYNFYIYIFTKTKSLATISRDK